MMANFQYKSSSNAAWTDVGKYSYHGTYAGTLEMVYPKPTERTIAGRACAAYGSPYIRLGSALMTATGMKFWQGLFATTTAVDVEFWLSSYDARSGTWKKWTGWLERPSYERVQIGNSDVGTLYSNVEIIMGQVTAAPEDSD